MFTCFVNNVSSYVCDCRTFLCNLYHGKNDPFAAMNMYFNASVTPLVRCTQLETDVFVTIKWPIIFKGLNEVQLWFNLLNVLTVANNQRSLDWLYISSLGMRWILQYQGWLVFGEMLDLNFSGRTGSSDWAFLLDFPQFYHQEVLGNWTWLQVLSSHNQPIFTHLFTSHLVLNRLCSWCIVIKMKSWLIQRNLCSECLKDHIIMSAELSSSIWNISSKTDLWGHYLMAPAAERNVEMYTQISHSYSCLCEPLLIFILQLNYLKRKLLCICFYVSEVLWVVEDCSSFIREVAFFNKGMGVACMPGYHDTHSSLWGSERNITRLLMFCAK